MKINTCVNCIGINISVDYVNFDHENYDLQQQFGGTLPALLENKLNSFIQNKE